MQCNTYKKNSALNNAPKARKGPKGIGVFRPCLVIKRYINPKTVPARLAMKIEPKAGRGPINTPINPANFTSPIPIPLVARASTNKNPAQEISPNKLAPIGTDQPRNASTAPIMIPGIVMALGNILCSRSIVLATNSKEKNKSLLTSAGKETSLEA